MSDKKIAEQNAAQLLLRSLVEQGTQFVFGIPGGKIMPTFDALNDVGPKLIVCRHEQNAAFMAGAIGRLTGRPGVCLVTSGPGTANLVTGAATATSEGDPMVAIGGVVPSSDSLKQVHQTMDSVVIMKPVTKYSVSIPTANATAEVVVNAFRAAMSPRCGAAFIGFPQDLQEQPTSVSVAPALPPASLGPAPSVAIRQAAITISRAKQPAILLGLGASEPRAAAAVRSLLKHSPMPVCGTFQGAGAVSRELAHLFCGRVGLFRNQPGDKLLALADVIVTVGYDPVEYGPESWNVAGRASIIHIDDYRCEIDNHYQPEIELIGSVEDTLSALSDGLPQADFVPSPELEAIQSGWRALQNPEAPASGTLVHPLNFVLTLRGLVDDETVIASDMGSHHIWMARHFFEFEPRKLLFSNGQQTLGVGIPWAMAASLLNPGKKVVATVGDGGFLYSSMELETAVREKLNMTVFVFRDGGYNMVAFQEELKFGRTSGVEFGNPDLVKYAESLGCTGLRVDAPEQLQAVMRKSLATPGVVVVDIPVDYSRNVEIGEHVLPDAWN